MTSTSCFFHSNDDTAPSRDYVNPDCGPRLFPPEAHVTIADTRLYPANFVFRLYHMLVP